MIKIKTNDQAVLLAEAYMILNEWLSRFEKPTCEEQEVVVIATLEWLDKVENNENI